MNQPTLLVGIGGSGLNTLAAVNRRLVSDPSMRDRMANDMFYLAVDTDKSALDHFHQAIDMDAAGTQAPFVQAIHLSRDVNALDEIINPFFVKPFSGKQDDPGLAQVACGTDEDPFRSLFLTPDQVEEAFLPTNDQTQFYHRVLKPIAECKEQLRNALLPRLHVLRELPFFVESAFDSKYGLLVKLASVDDPDVAIFMLNKWRSDIAADVTRFVYEEFSFRKVLERNLELLNRYGDISFYWVETALGMTKDVGAMSYVDIVKATICRICSSCTPWWTMNPCFRVDSHLAFLSEQSELETARTMRESECAIFDWERGYRNCFSLLVFSESLPNPKANPLEETDSFDYYKDASLIGMLIQAENPAGTSMFDKSGRGFGYVFPVFVHNRNWREARWRPWMKSGDFEMVIAESQEPQVQVSMIEQPMPESTQEEAADVFISYRRTTGLDKARIFQQALKARGFTVFFDFDSLQDGVFNHAIFKAIEECKVFIAFLSEGSLDRCANEDDWVRTELEHAFKFDKKVIPIAVTEVYNHWQ